MRKNKNESKELESNFLKNEYDGLDQETYYTSVIKLPEKITSTAISVDAKFSDKSDTIFLYEYLEKNESRYTPYINTLRNNVVRIKDNTIANNIFGDLYGEFNTVIDTVEIFDVIVTYFGFEYKDFFDKLILRYRNQLIKDLSKRKDIKL